MFTSSHPLHFHMHSDHLHGMHFIFLDHLPILVQNKKVQLSLVVAFLFLHATFLSPTLNQIKLKSDLHGERKLLSPSRKIERNNFSLAGLFLLTSQLFFGTAPYC